MADPHSDEGAAAEGLARTTFYLTLLGIVLYIGAVLVLAR